jgi:hypothetical protein
MRGHRRLGRIFNESACVEGYRDLLKTLAGSPEQPAPAIGLAA